MLNKPEALYAAPMIIFALLIGLRVFVRDGDGRRMPITGSPDRVSYGLACSLLLASAVAYMVLPTIVGRVVSGVAVLTTLVHVYIAASPGRFAGGDDNRVP